MNAVAASVTPSESVPMTVEDVEKIMETIENDSTGKPPVAPVVAPSTTVITGAPTGSPFALREFVDVGQLKLDVQFDPNDLDSAVMHHASLFVHYANQARLARRQRDNMKVANEVLESRLYAIHREKLLKDGGKATEGLIDAAVKSDPRWYNAQKRQIDAQAIYDLANDARNAFEQRKDMIVQISVDRREEKKGSLRVMEANADARSIEAARANALRLAGGK